MPRELLAIFFLIKYDYNIMEAIIDYLPCSVLEYRDPNGKNITDYEFDPITDAAAVTVDHDTVVDIIQNRIKNIRIADDTDDHLLECILREGHIRVLIHEGESKLTLHNYHVDFMSGNIEGSSYYGQYESDKTVILNHPLPPIIGNNLIRLGGGTGIQNYSGEITSQYIHHSNCINVPNVGKLYNLSSISHPSTRQLVDNNTINMMRLRYYIDRNHEYYIKDSAMTRIYIDNLRADVERANTRIYYLLSILTLIGIWRIFR